MRHDHEIDEITQLRSRMLDQLLVVMIIMSLLSAVAGAVYSSSNEVSANFYLWIVVFVAMCTWIQLLHRHKPEQMRSVLIGVLAIMSISADVPAELLFGRSTFFALLPIVVAGLLWPAWATAILACVEVVAHLVLAAVIGYNLDVLNVPLLMAVLLTALVVGQAKVLTDHAIRRLLWRELLMRSTADVSRIAAAGLNLNEFLTQISNLIHDRFDLYYVGLFLVDESGEWSGEPRRWVVLRAGTGEAGQLMLEQEHRFNLEYPNSLIARCVVEQKAVIVDNVGQEAHRFDNPLLPKTKSEAAFPLMLAGNTIGAMTVQSSQENAFDRDMQIVLQAMADQIAVAIDGTQTQVRYQEIVDIQRELIVRFREDGAIIYTNPAFRRFFSEILPEGKHVLSVMGVQSENWERVLESLKKGTPRVYEYQVFALGSTHWMEFTSREAEGGYQVVGRDVTERVVAQRDLAESEVRYWSLVAYAPTGILLADGQGDILDVNDRLLEILGLPSREATMAINIFEFSSFVEAGIAENFRACLSSQKERQHEGWYISKWGKRVYCHIYLAPIRLSGQVCVLAHFADYTEQKRTEAHVAHIAKMESLARLTGGIVHDFNNYLTVIIGNAGTLPASPEASQIKEAAEQSAALTTQLLAFSRKQPFGLISVVDVNAIVTDMKPLLQRLVGESINFVTQLDGTHLVFANPAQIKQVILNLVVNAHDAMPHGGSLDITTDDDANFLMICVSDTGTGMTDEVKEHLFEPFFTTKEDGKGTGLGLSTVHGIVQQAGGHIDVHSEPGQGTTFRVYLPRTEKPISESPPLVNEVDVTGYEVILVVEDAPLVRDFIVRTLEQNGYTVLQAGTINEALAQTQEIDLLVTDLVLPDGTGPQIAQERGCKMLLLSGYTPGISEDVNVHNARHFLPKPFSPGALARAVRIALDDEVLT